jgi:hypothetical protein
MQPRGDEGPSSKRLTDVDLSLLGLVRRVGARAARPALPLGSPFARLSDRELEALAVSALASVIAEAQPGPKPSRVRTR